MKQIFDKYLVSKDGRVFSIKQGRLKQISPSSDCGYKKVCLYVDKKRRTFRVHRLVAMCYLENENEYEQVNHKNGVKVDNRVENLEWCTAQQNDEHARKMGLKGGRYKVTDGMIMEVELLTYYGLSTREIGRIVGLGKNTISLIQRELRGIEQSRVYQIKD